MGIKTTCLLYILKSLGVTQGNELCTFPVETQTFVLTKITRTRYTIQLQWHKYSRPDFYDQSILSQCDILTVIVHLSFQTTWRWKYLCWKGGSPYCLQTQYCSRGIVLSHCHRPSGLSNLLSLLQHACPISSLLGYCYIWEYCQDIRVQQGMFL